MKRQHILYFSILSMLCLGMPAYAQDEDVDDDEIVVAPKKKVVKIPTYPTVEVKGQCIDAATKKPLAGVMIQALNDKNYTAMTEEDGTFVIKVPTFATALYVHAPEFMSQHVGLGRQGTPLTIEMLSDKFRPMYDNTTHIVAEATANVRNTTSHTVETDIEELMGADVRSITRSGGPGYGAAMFVRGLSSLNANAQPLIVIDGVVQDMQQTRSTLHYGDYTNLLLNINPEDIDKVTVLKNATALYGAKGAAGVILIETKRGHSMATRIDANIGVGVTLEPRTPEVMNAAQYRVYASEMLGSYPDISLYTDPQTFKFLVDDPSKYYYAKFHNDTDWKDEVYHTVLNQNYNINVQGGDDVGMYNLSLGYTDGKSTARKNGFDRLNVRFNTDINIINRLTTRFDMSYTKVNRDVFDNGAPESLLTGTISSPTFLALVKSPFLNPYTFNNVTRKLSSTLSDADDYLTVLDQDLTLGNPTALLANGEAINKNRVEMTHFNTVIAPRYEFNDHLVLTETFSYTLDRVSQRYYRPEGGMPTFLIDGIGRVQNMSKSMFSKETAVVSDTRLGWSRQLREHFVNAFAGFRFSSFAFDDNEPEGQYSSAGNDKTPNISKDMDFIDATGTDDSWRSMTWYGNVDYNFRNRYFAQLMLAVESCSRFGREADGGLKIAGVKWGIFPSLQLGWVLTNEAWFPKNKGISYLLLKAGYDISGNDDIAGNAARTSFSVTKYLYKSTAALLDNIGNESITWEQTGKMNVGLKAYFLNNRIGLDFDYYMSHTKNLLTLKTFENPVAGINNYWSNGGSLDNTGFEVTLTAKPIVTRQFNMELGVSAGHYVNKVKSLPDNTRIYMNGQPTAQGYTSSIYGSDNIATIVGQPVGMFYGYKTDGVFADDKEAAAAGKAGYLYLIDETGARQNFKAGDVRFVDINGDGIIGEADRTIIGNPNPDIYGNIFANVNWKNLTLHVGLNYSLGNDIFNYQRSLLESGSNFYNQTTAMTNRWRAEGQQTDIPRVTYGDPMGNSRFSDRWIEDGSYLRLKTVRLNYRVPVNYSWLQGLSVWAEANNLLTVTRYLGNDPEASVANAVLYQGIDAGNIALGRTFTLGLKINL
ncbi:MAG: SusC/RagA family TonB-linked outer membrane protein [Prevotella sp.]|nr:SusC/RagA family TonB-linked outer membrane protein [Prevotella sp.]